MQQIYGILAGLPQAQIIVLSIFPVLFAITVHEVAHGWVAKQYGDLTADRLGRLSLNPIKHIDPIGTVLMPLLLILVKSPFLFGYAKPVPVAFQNLRQPKRDMVKVAVAGPVSNLLMAFAWTVIAWIGLLLFRFDVPLVINLVYMALIGILVNIILMVVNLIPLPPLDGGRVAVGLLPGPWAWRLSRVEPYGLFIVFGLLVTGLLGAILWPIIDFIGKLFAFLLGI